MKKQEFTVLKIADLHPFPDNPFHMAADETLTETEAKELLEALQTHFEN